MRLTRTREHKTGIRILPTGAVRRIRKPEKGELIFESRTHMLYVKPQGKFQDAQNMAKAFLATHGHDTEVRFRGAHQ